MIDKKFIIEKIRELAEENDGSAPGLKTFNRSTGIPTSAWRGIFWINWSEAILEAGFTPNSRTEPYSDDYILTNLAKLTIKLGKFPTFSHIRMEKKKNAKFPAYQAIARLGRQAEQIERLRTFAGKKNAFAKILDLLPEPSPDAKNADRNAPSNIKEGFVYLAVLKIGSIKRYKIGKTNLVTRRSAELSLQLPEKIELVHYIITDDPTGIEKYWHDRFVDKNTNGEWFDLSAEDIKAFKKRKFM